MHSSGSRRRLIRAAIAVVTAVVALSATACSDNSSNSASNSGKMTVVLPWYADPEGGGYFAAQAEGLYRNAGLDVTLQPGGPQVSATQLVAAGRAQIGHTDAAGIVQAQQQGIPIIAVAALYQDNPVGILSHSDQNITTFDQMKGRTLVSQAGALYPVWLDKQLGVPMQTMQYQGSIANFLKDPKLLQQGWPTNEVRQAEQSGVPVNFTPYSTSGFNPYNDVLFTSKSYFDAHKDELRKFLQASLSGWHDYLGDVAVATDANKAILAANSEQTAASVWYAWDKQRPYVIAGDGAKQLGAMTEQRWTTLIDQLQKLGQLTGKAPATADLYDASLLPTVAAPALPAAPTGSY